MYLHNRALLKEKAKRKGAHTPQASTNLGKRRNGQGGVLLLRVGLLQVAALHGGRSVAPLLRRPLPGKLHGPHQLAGFRRRRRGRRRTNDVPAAPPTKGGRHPFRPGKRGGRLPRQSSGQRRGKGRGRRRGRGIRRGRRQRLGLLRRWQLRGPPLTCAYIMKMKQERTRNNLRHVYRHI